MLLKIWLRGFNSTTSFSQKGRRPYRQCQYPSYPHYNPLYNVVQPKVLSEKETVGLCISS